MPTTPGLPTAPAAAPASPSPWRAGGRSRRLLRRMLPAIAALLLLIGLGGYLLVANALRQDVDVQQRSRTFIARSIAQVRNEVGRNIINYSKWGEAYKNLHLTVNKTWADEQRNVGDIPFDLYGYDGVFVIGPRGRTVYAVVRGQASAVQAHDWLRGDLDGLVAAARDPRHEDTSIVRALQVAGSPALVAAATITPGWDPGIRPRPGPASVMVFATVLDAPRLSALSENYGVPALTISSEPLAGQESMPLLDSSMRLHWRPPTPGRTLLGQTLPLFIAGVLALAGVLIALLRHALASARQIDAQFEALHATQAELTESEQRFRDIAEASSDWLWEVDARGRLTYLSERFTQVTGEPREDWLGRPLADLLKPATTGPQAPPPDLPADAGDSPARGTRLWQYRDRAGRLRTSKITSRAMAHGAGYRGTATDITDEVEAQARVRHLSLHDPLTDLPNRLHLQQFLARQLEAPAPRPTPALALLCLDLDRFKPVNDAWGHGLGDLLLQAVAQRLRGQMPPGALAARVGGDEFVAVLPDMADRAAVEAVCHALVQALGQPFRIQGHDIAIGTSIGIALAPAHAREPAELLRMADIALYRAKDAGRSTWQFYERAMEAALPPAPAGTAPAPEPRPAGRTD